MNVEFYSLHWNNVDPDMLKYHKEVMQFFNIDVIYHNFDRMDHAKWLEYIVTESKADIVACFEPDCIPLNDKYLQYIDYAYKHNTFVGIAQVANHIHPKRHVYAGTGFYCISKKMYELLGRPPYTPTYRGDTGAELCYKAEELGLRFRTLVPTCFEKEPEEGIWPLGSLGYFGIGTVYDNSIYHLFQARYAQNIELFIKHCKEVLSGTFDCSNFYSSTTFNYSGKIVP